MLDENKAIKRLSMITSLSIDGIILILILIVFFLPLKTESRLLRLVGLGSGVLITKVGFYLLRELNKLEAVPNAENHLQENNFLNQITTLKALNDQYYQRQLQPPVAPQNYQDDSIYDEIEKEETLLQPEQSNNFYNWNVCIDEAVGFIISGNSGSGKTSVACWLAGLLTQEKPAQVLALDPHYNDTWEQVGIKSVGKIELIETILKWLVNELNLRCDRKSKKLPLGDDLIIFCDETNACLERFEDPKNIESAIKRLGSEGRKFGITFIIINQSHNATDLGISKKYLNNYFLIGLGASARAIIDENYRQGTPEKDYIKSVAYPCVVSGSVPVQLALHPTHHSYTNYKKQGNPPLNLIPINQLPLLILNEATAHRPVVHSTQLEPLPLWEATEPPLSTREALERVFSLDTDDLCCPQCQSINIKNNGKTMAGSIKKKCNNCGKNWTVKE